MLLCWTHGVGVFFPVLGPFSESPWGGSGVGCFLVADLLVFVGVCSWEPWFMSKDAGCDPMRPPAGARPATGRQTLLRKVVDGQLPTTNYLTRAPADQELHCAMRGAGAGVASRRKHCRKEESAAGVGRVCRCPVLCIPPG